MKIFLLKFEFTSTVCWRTAWISYDPGNSENRSLAQNTMLLIRSTDIKNSCFF